ncbi:hypothetical protein ACFQX9_05150 [Bradyrhizobium sp. GCM10028915]|uniref:hypothetical protein n=1 Tax=Bradyrhizobium sp. GCM10028915 TaxID=3273385 RepID=UPI003615CA73
MVHYAETAQQIAYTSNFDWGLCKETSLAEQLGRAVADLQFCFASHTAHLDLNLPVLHRPKPQLDTNCGAERTLTWGAMMPISISMMILGAQLLVPVADNVPKFDMARSCKLDLAATAGLSVGQSLKSCVNDEQKARRQLGALWTKMSVAQRESCAGQEAVGGTPSYVSLLTCLQMDQWVLKP